MRLIELTEADSNQRVIINVNRIDLIYFVPEFDRVCIKVSEKEFLVTESEHEILLKIRG